MDLILYKHPHVTGLLLRDTELQPNIALRSLIQEAITKILSERENEVPLLGTFMYISS